MKGSDIMVSDVITAKPEDSVRDVAKLLLKHRISAMPVIGAKGELLGIVSEGDLMRRTELGTAPQRSWWLQLFTRSEVLAAEFVKANACTVGDVMTRNVVTTSPDTSVGEIAALLETNGIKRVPIVKDAKLVGIVSRANLLQALASLDGKTEIAASPDDAKLRDQIVKRLKSEPWQPWMLNVTVHNGMVDLWGIVESQAEKAATRIATEAMPGVRAVNDNLFVRPTNAGS